VNILKRIVQPVQPRAADPLKRAGLRPGLYHYQRDSGEGTFTRFHLRVDPDGNGVLLANATAAARLRPAGVIVAKGLLDGQSPERIVGQLQHVFRAFSRRQAEADIERVGRLIAELDSPGDNYPILNLDDPAFAGDVPPLEKPLAADLPLCAPERLETLARRLWDLGIPQARFLAGEVLDAAVAVRAVELAEDLGMIAGLRACAGALDQGNLIADLAQAGVDHLDIRCFALVESVHDALAGAGEFGRLRRVIDAIHRCEVCPVAVMPLVRQTVDSIEESIEAAAQMRLGALALFAVATTEPDESGGPLYADELFQVARLIEEAADELGVRLLWYAPVRFDPSRPLDRQLAAGPRTSGDMAIRVHPDGSVYVARGPALPAGNLLVQDWEEIADSAVFRRYRHLVQTAVHCEQCPGLICRPLDCPRNPARWAEPLGAAGQ